MEPINISSSIGNYQKETPANFLITKVAAEKKGSRKKNFQKKNVYTELKQVFVTAVISNVRYLFYNLTT